MFHALGIISSSDDNGPKPGDLTPEGVYVGQYTLRDNSGNSLGKTFNLYAAPQDFPGIKTYVDMACSVGELKNWHGFNGTFYRDENQLHTDLENGKYNGGWFIPTSEMLCGLHTYGGTAMENTLYALRNKGAFKGTFKANALLSTDWYWSCTRALSDNFCNFAFRRGKDDANAYNHYRMNCRPVRLVEVVNDSTDKTPATTERQRRRFKV